MAGELMAPTVGLTVMDATTRSTPGTPITTEVRQEQVIANLRQQADDVRERERERSQRMARLGGGGFKAQEGPEAELRELRKSFKTMPTKEVPRDLAGKQPMQMSNPVEGAAQKINKWFYTAAVKEQQEERAIQHQAYIASIEAMHKQAEKERQAQQQLLGMNDPLNEGSPSEAFAPLTMPEPENAQESIDWWNKHFATPNDPMRPTISTWQEYQAVMGMAKAEQRRANVRLHPEAYIPTDYVSQMMDSGVSFNTIAQNAKFDWDTGRINVTDKTGEILGSFSPDGGMQHGLVNRGGDYAIGLMTHMANVDRLTQSGLWDQATIDSVKGSLNMLDTIQQRMQAGKTETGKTETGKTETGTSFALPTNLQSDYDVWRKMRGAEVAGAETYQQNAARLISSPVLSDPDSGRHSATNQGKEIVSTVQVDGVGLTAAIDAAQNLKTLVNLPGGNSTAVNGLIGQGESVPTGIGHSIGAGIGGGAMLDGLAVPASSSPTLTDTDNLRHASALVNQGGIPTVTPATPAIAAAVATPSSDTLLSLYANRPSTLYNPDGLRFQQKIWGDSRIDAWKKYTPGETAEGVEAMLAFYNQRDGAGNRINYMAPELRSNLLTEIAKSYSRGGASFNPVRQFADVYEKTENIQGLPFMDTYFGKTGAHMRPDQEVDALASVITTASGAGYRFSDSQREQYQAMLDSYTNRGLFDPTRYHPASDRQVPTAGQMLQYVKENAAIEGPSVDLGLTRPRSVVSPGTGYTNSPFTSMADRQKTIGDSRIDAWSKYTPFDTEEGVAAVIDIARRQGGMSGGVRESLNLDVANSYNRDWGMPGVRGTDRFAEVQRAIAGLGTGTPDPAGTGIGGGARLGGLAVPVSPSPTATDTDNLRHASALVNQGGIPTVTPATPAIAAAVATPSSDTLLSLYANRPSTLYNPDGLRFQQKTWGDSRIDAWKKYTPGETAEGVEAMLAFYNQRDGAGNRINYMAPELRSNLLTEIAKSYARGGASFNPVRQFADVYEKTENIQGLPFMDTYFGRAGSSHMSPDQRVNALASVVKTATDAGYRLSESQQEQYQKMVQSYDDQGFFSSSRTIDRQVPTAGQMLQYVKENAAIEGPSVDLGLTRPRSVVSPGTGYTNSPFTSMADRQKTIGDSRIDAWSKYTPWDTEEGVAAVIDIAQRQGGMSGGVRESLNLDVANSYNRDWEMPGVRGTDRFAEVQRAIAGLGTGTPDPGTGSPARSEPIDTVPSPAGSSPSSTPATPVSAPIAAGIGAGTTVPGLMYLTAMMNRQSSSAASPVTIVAPSSATAALNEMLAGRQPLPALPGTEPRSDVPEFTLFTSQSKTATIGDKGSLNTITETPLQIRAGEENWAQVSATLNQYVQHNDPIPAQVQTDLKKIVEENVQWETASDKRRAIQYIDDYTKMAEQTDRIDTLFATVQKENRDLTDGEIRDAYRMVSEIGKYDADVARQYKGIVHDAEVKKYVDAGIGTLQEYGDSMDQAEIDRRISGLDTAINQFGNDDLKTYYRAIPAGIMKAAPFIKDINRMFGVDPSHDWGALAKEGVLTDEGLQEAIAARDKAIDTQLAGMPDAFRTELKQNSRNAFEYYDIMSEANRLAADARASRITDAEFQTRSQALSDRMAKFDQTSGMTLFSAKSAYTNIATGKTRETGPTYGEQVIQDIAARKGEQFNEQMFRQGVADLPVVGGVVATGMFGLETIGQVGERAGLDNVPGVGLIVGAMQAPAVFSREAYIGLMHPSHQGITVEMPEFKKFALGLDESIGNEKRQWVTGEAAHAWSAGVREGIIGDQNDPLHTVRSGAAGVAGVGTGLATTPSMFATIGMVQAMESPATMAKIVAGGIGRFAGSTGRYLGTDPTGAISELGAAAVVGSYGPRAVGALRTRVPAIQTRPFALSQRVVESRPFRLAERAYQTSQVSRDQMGATWTALKMGERIRDLNVNLHTSADTILGWMPDSLKAGIRSGLQKTDGPHLITGEAPMKFALGDAGMPAAELHRAMGDKFTRDGVQEVTILAEKPERAFLNLRREITAAFREAGIPVDETVTILNRDRTPTGKRQETGDWKKTTRDTDTGRGDAIEISTPGVKFYQRTEASGDVSYLIRSVDADGRPTVISVTKGQVVDGVINPGYGIVRASPVRAGPPNRVTLWQRITGQNKPERTVTGSPVKDLALSDTESILNRGPEPGQIPTTVTIDGLNFHNPVDYYGRIVPEQIWLAGRMDRTNAVQARGMFGVRGALQDRYVDVVNAYRKHEFNTSPAKRDADLLTTFSNTLETLPQTYQVAVPKPVQAAMHRVVAREPNTVFPAIADNMLINDVNQYVSSSHLRRPSLTTVPRKDRAFEQRNRQILTKQIDTDLYDLLAGARSIARVKEYELGGIGKSAATHPDAIDIRTINADLNKLGKMREDLQGLINDYRAGGERRARADAAVAEYRRDAATPKDLANPDIRRTDFDRDLYAQNAYIAEHGNKATLPTLELMLGDVDSAIRRQTAIHDVRTKMQAETFAEAERARRPGIGTRLRTLGRKTDVQKIDAIDTVLADVQRPTRITRRRDALYQQETDLTTTINTLRPELERTVWQGGVIIDDTVPISSDMAQVLRTVPSRYVKKYTTTVPNVAETMTQRNLQTYLKGAEDYRADIRNQRVAVEQSPRNLQGRMIREYEWRTSEEQLPFRDTERAALKNIPLPVNRDVSMVSQGHFANIYEWLDSIKHRQFKQDVGGSITDDTRPIGPVGSGKESATDSKPSTASVVRARDIVSKPSHDSSLGPTSGGSGGDVQSVLLDMSRQQESPQSTMTREYIWEDMIARPTRHTSAITPRFALSVGTGGTFGTFRDAVEPIEAPTPTVQKPGISLMMTTDLAKEQKVPYDVRTKTQLATIGVQGAAVEQKVAAATTTTYAPAPAPTPTTPGRWGNTPIMPVVRRPITPRPPLRLPRLDLSGGGGKSDKKKIETGKRKIVHPIATPDQMIGKGVFSIRFNHLTVDKEMTKAWGMGATGKHTVNTTRRVKRTQVAANIGDALTTVTSMKRSKKIRGLVF